MRPRKFIYWSAVAGVWALIGAVGLIVYNVAQLPPIDQLAIPKRPPNIAILADDGSLLANRGDAGGGPPIRLGDLPAYVPQAFVAIEDRRFYSHGGIDPIGILRAALSDVMGHRGLEGGSTLTQQLARNLFLTQERTLTRKIQEAILSVWLERRYSKKKILELYLNRVYFGSGAYGIEAAAQKYFNRHARDLTLEQAAELAGLMKAPSKLAPDRNPEGAAQRAGEVISAMRAQGYISQTAARYAMNHPARAERRAGSDAMNYFADYVMDELADDVGGIDQDVTVRTTIDPRLEAAAQAALVGTLNSEGARKRVGQGALVALDPTGAVKALIGGRDYAKSQFDRATSAHRQPGSTFKPFVYLAALEQGLTPATIRDDAPITVHGWSPEDAERRFLGPVTLTKALALSLNAVAVRLVLEVGPAKVAAVAHRLGVTSQLQADPSLALGTSDVTPLEMTDAYAPFANGGFRVRPHTILSVRTASGRLLYRRPSYPARRVVAPQYVGMMNAMLQQTLQIGTGRRAALPGWQAAGKTGTSQHNRDAWFIGYTSRMIAGVWLGNDDSSPTRGVAGGGLPALIWSRFMQAAHRGLAPSPLPGDWTPEQSAAVADGSGTFSQTPFARPAAALGALFGNSSPSDQEAQRSLAPPAAIPTHGGATFPSKSLLEKLFGG